MRLHFGPYATRLAEQVLIRDPFFVVQTLADQPGSVLARVFCELIGIFDAKLLRHRCSRCSGPASGVCAYPGSVSLIGFCELCVLRSPLTHPLPAHRLAGYEDAIRHVTSSFPRGHRVQMRRIITGLLLLKGGPVRLTEDAAMRFFHHR